MIGSANIKPSPMPESVTNYFGKPGIERTTDELAAALEDVRRAKAALEVVTEQLLVEVADRTDWDGPTVAPLIGDSSEQFLTTKLAGLRARVPGPNAPRLW